MLLHLSPCPNDTFSFHAMVHGLVDCEGLTFEAVLEDVEQLNRRVLFSNPHVCKVSCRLIPEILSRYAILPCGSAIGFGNGPLLVSRIPFSSISPKTLIATPGIHTTAAFLLQFAYPQAVNTSHILFSEIANSILQHTYDAGVLIHEGRFLYQEQGLHLVADLGKYWEKRTGLPIPLGAIVVSRTLPKELQHKIARILRRSIHYAMEHPKSSWEYVTNNARELDATVIINHIKLFVNDFSLELGPTGRLAIETLIKSTLSKEKCHTIDFKNIFLS